LIWNDRLFYHFAGKRKLLNGYKALSNQANPSEINK
jgi:hypothetical protein